MPVLDNPKHEKFALAMAKGQSAGEAYVAAGYAAGHAAVNAGRLTKNDNIQARIRELRTQISRQLIELEVTNRNNRLQAIQHRWDLMRELVFERGRHEDYQRVPGGSTGLLTLDYKGKDANQPIYRFDAPLMAEMRLAEKQAAIETGQWSEMAAPQQVTRAFAGSVEELLVIYRRVQTTESGSPGELPSHAGACEISTTGESC